MAPRIRFLSALILLMFCGVTYARLLSDPSELVSDGKGFHGFPSLLRLGAAEETCEQSYGFLPCTTTALGNLFLIIVYGYLMFLAATYLSTGSELLLEILGPGIVGGLFLPILGALPDTMLILVSGLSGSVETAQSQVSVGMGLLAGSTVMLLTIIWGSCVLVGKCDIRNSIAIDSEDTEGFSFTGSGVTTDSWTSYAGIIMAVSVIPFVVVQLPQILRITSGKHLVVLISLIISASLLIAYCLYQIFQPLVQKRRLAYAKDKHVMTGVLKNLKMRAMGRLYNDDGSPNREVILKLFDAIDMNHDNHLSHGELIALIVGIQLDEINLQEDVAVQKVMMEFDTSRDLKISRKEFVKGIEKWLTRDKPSSSISTKKHLDDLHLQARREHDLLADESYEVVKGKENNRWISIKAVLLLLLGTAIAAAFADPLVDAVDNFSAATSIPTFFISFIALPLATNSSEAVSAIIFASRKKRSSASLTFSELYGAVTMNNVRCLSVFLTLVYVRGLDWDFSSEVLIILVVCIVMGILASVRTTYPLWTSLLAFLLYPISLVLVYILDYVVGWS